MGGSLRIMMATTVKSLEDRIDEFSADVYTRLDAIDLRLDAIETRMAVVESKIVQLESRFDRLDDKAQKLSETFAEFRGEVQVTLRFMKWIGGTATVAMISVILASISVAWTAGNLNNKVQEQQATLKEIKDALEPLKK
jgi:predicted nuclease with TOPRIM domain